MNLVSIAFVRWQVSQCFQYGVNLASCDWSILTSRTKFTQSGERDEFMWFYGASERQKRLWRESPFVCRRRLDRFSQRRTLADYVLRTDGLYLLIMMDRARQYHEHVLKSNFYLLQVNQVICCQKHWSVGIH